MYSSSFFMPSTLRTLDIILTVRQCKVDQSENFNEDLVYLPTPGLLASFKIPLQSPGTSGKHLMVKRRFMSKCLAILKEKKLEKKGKRNGYRRESKMFWDYFG